MTTLAPTPTKATMLQLLPTEADLLCLHPMFGPESGKDDWYGPPT